VPIGSAGTGGAAAEDDALAIALADAEALDRGAAVAVADDAAGETVVDV